MRISEAYIYYFFFQFCDEIQLKNKISIEFKISAFLMEIVITTTVACNGNLTMTLKKITITTDTT